jgi:hypothetical protein
MKHALAIAALPVLAVIAVGSMAIGGGLAARFIDAPDGILPAGMVFLFSCFIAARAANAAHQLFLFIHSQDRPSRNRIFPSL